MLNRKYRNIGLCVFAIVLSLVLLKCAMGWGIIPAIVGGGKTPGYGNGSDGEFTSTGAHIINSYTRITDASVASGTAVINVNSAASILAGDIVLILQTQHATNHGKYEFAKVSSINGNAITLTTNLVNSYYSGTYDNVAASAAEVIQVPQYTNVIVSVGHSITCTDWDATTGEGGVVVFYAIGTITVNGTIEVNEAAFRGGSGNWQGESYKGKGENSRSANDGAGGGGDGVNGSYATGGGGGHLTAGDIGVTPGAPTSVPGDGGGSYGEATLLQTIYFGSGGGGSDYDTIDTSNGGKGGGIVIIKAENIIIDAAGTISANGQAGQKGGHPASVYGARGSGGSVLLISNSYTNNGTVQAIDQGNGTNASDGIVVEPA